MTYRPNEDGTTSLNHVSTEKQPIAPTADAWAFTEDYVPISEAVRAARDEAILNGITPISTGVVAFLGVLAAAMRAKNVVEVGTLHGGSGAAFLEAMPSDGVLTSIDLAAEQQLWARQVFQQAGFPSSRYRLIAGNPLDILPKLRDGAYDIVFINGTKLDYVEFVYTAGRLLRTGGVLILHDALWFNGVPDQADESDEAIIIRDALEALTNSEQYAQSLLPVGNGLLLATRK